MDAPLICAGFHRSGTSLAAQQLHGMGLSYAVEPMGGSLSNPDGHFEDERAMHLHDRLLSLGGHDWTYSAQTPFIPPEVSVAELRRYISVRNQLSGSRWVMKDPRATLLLNEWQQALNNKGRFLLVYRHWSYCVQSLLKRHARELVCARLNNHPTDTHLAFFKDVTLAARMWLTYNQHLLDFALQNPDACVLISQADLMDGLELSPLLNTKFGWQLKHAEGGFVRPEYAEEHVESDVLELLPADLIQDMDRLYKRLQQINGSGASKTDITVRNSHPDPQLADYLTQQISSASPERTESSHHHSAGVHLAQLASHAETLSFQDLHQRINALAEHLCDETAGYFRTVARQLVRKNEFHFSGYAWLGRYALLKKDYVEAEFQLLRAMSFNDSPAYLHMLLGDVYQARFEFRRALKFYQQAYHLNPSHADFMVRLGDISLLMNEGKSACDWYKKALELRPSEGVRIKYSQALVRVQQAEQALQYLQSLYESDPRDVYRHESLKLRLALRKSGARAESRHFIDGRLSRDRMTGLLRHIAGHDLQHESLLLLSRWLTRQWLDTWSATELLALFVPVTGRVSANPKISAVVVSYDMARELPRTLYSLQAPYQQGLSAEDIEIILIDNGSACPPARSDFADIPNLRVVSYPFATQSPARAVNLGLHLARSECVGVFIDGARMASPGLMKHVLQASRLSESTLVATLGFHLGPEVQMSSVLKGYNQSVEDRLLTHSGWKEDGYRLFSISALAGSSANGYFHPIAESNALFMSRGQWQTLGGVDERFVTPGGGFVNLDLYKRACEQENTQLVVLLGEGTFHQVHGGVATNCRRADATHQIFADEYRRIRGKEFVRPDTAPLYFGQFNPASAHFLQYSVAAASEPEAAEVSAERNRILLDETYCSLFATQQTVADALIDAPIIITGRGGSGTRLLSGLIQDMNIFMGNDINDTEDSLEWVGPVYDLVVNRVRIANGSFTPEHISRLRNNAANVLQKGGVESGLWGFKLPETMLCLPELKRAFPRARFIHLTRHPVSISMRRTHMTSRLNNPVGRAVLEDAWQFIGRHPGSLGDGADEVNNSVSWNYQLHKAMAFFSELGEGRDVIQVKYEDLISCPDWVLARLREFLGMKKVQDVSLNIEHERTNVVLESTPLSELVWSVCEDVATRIGYSKVG